MVKHAAEKWLSSRGRTKPNLWGIAVLTYFSHVTLPEGRSLEDGSPIDVQGRSGVHLALAANPHYVGVPQLQLLPG